MYQTITEPIEVAAVFRQGKVMPKKFKWRQRVYPIDQITLSADFKDGGVRQRLYAVVAAGNTYRLRYNRESEQWLLVEVWVE